MATRLPRIDPGFHVFLAGEEEECGAVREVQPGRIVVSIENGGDFDVEPDAIESVIEEKVFLRPERLEPRMREAIAHAHEEEDYPPPEHREPETGSA